MLKWLGGEKVGSLRYRERDHHGEGPHGQFVKDSPNEKRGHTDAKRRENFMAVMV